MQSIRLCQDVFKLYSSHLDEQVFGRGGHEDAVTPGWTSSVHVLLSLTGVFTVRIAAQTHTVFTQNLWLCSTITTLQMHFHFKTAAAPREQMGHDTDTVDIRSSWFQMLMMDFQREIIIRLRWVKCMVCYYKCKCSVMIRTTISSRNHSVHLTKTAQVHDARQNQQHCFILLSENDAYFHYNLAIVMRFKHISL